MVKNLMLVLIVFLELIFIVKDVIFTNSKIIMFVVISKIFKVLFTIAFEVNLWLC